MSEPRYAIYFIPARASPLYRFGAAVLGYDAYTGDAIPRSGLGGVDEQALSAITAEARRYGFHATLKAPFRLAEGCTPEVLAAAIGALAASRGGTRIGRLEPLLLGPFLALVPTAPLPALELLAAECVESFDPFRAPLEAVDRDRRHRAGLTSRQSALLERWGYPYVFDQFRFHLTLTGPIPPAERESWLRRLSSAFEVADPPGATIDSLTLVREDADARFRVVESFALRGDEDVR